jgi:hypothetical protein
MKAARPPTPLAPGAVARTGNARPLTTWGITFTLPLATVHDDTDLDGERGMWIVGALKARGPKLENTGQSRRLTIEVTILL